MILIGRLRLGAAVVALVVLLVGGLALLGAGLWAGASAAERATLGDVLRSQAAFLVSGVVLLAGLLGLTVVRLFGRHVQLPRRLTADTRLIATANPGHRLDVRRPPELAELAAGINDLAVRYEAAERDVAARVEAGRADVAQERNRLAALMSELAAAVLVCNAEGRILLYNDAARRLLADRPDRAGIVGLGRSVFGVVDRDLVAHLLDRAGTGAPAHATTAWADRLLRVSVAAAGPSRRRRPARPSEATGFVMLVDDVTRRSETTRHRDALLRDLTEGVRGSAGAIQGAIESLLEYPDMPADQRERFVLIVRDEAAALGERVAALTRESAEHLTDRSLHEDMSAADLIAAVTATVAAEHGPAITAGPPGDGLWLTLDGYAAVRAVATLLNRLRTAHGVDEVTLSLEPAGRYTELTARWRGDPVDAGTLREWTASPATGAGKDTVADILAQHEAQVWSRRDDDGTAYLRLLLPLAGEPASEAAGEAARPAPAHLTEADPGGAARDRPEFYDFDLFQATAADIDWEHRPLDAVAYTVFDTETTGLEPAEGDEIIAMGAVRVLNGRLLRQETFDRLVDPRRPVPAASRRIHGITSEMLRGQPTIDEVLPALARFAEDTVLVGHNVSFDLAFLRRAEARTGVAFSQPVLDTLLLSAAVHPDHEAHTMEAIAERLGLTVLGRHSALGDALLTAEIFVRLLPLLRGRGVHTVGQAREAARRTYLARLDEAHYSGGARRGLQGQHNSS
ncbi:MAG TPA: exonuclease domain-containing protein [Pilimelia sp.]|nr:exonuclease domain-containing protein [Pilimelia sp.]